MDFLKEWVRNLVMLVILASCLELFLPMNSMKKFVRMVLGLLVVLAVMQPALALLGQPGTVDATALLGEDRRDLPSLQEIMAQADEFREKNQALLAEEAQARVADEVREAAKGVSGVADARAVVKLTVDGSEWHLEDLTVTIRPGDGRSGPVTPVEPVRPVGIGQGRPPEAPEQPPPRERQELERRLAEQVRQAVIQRLGLQGQSQQIRVVVE